MTQPMPSSGDPFSALGDSNRRAIVALLRGGERSVQGIADSLPISRPAVSRHLRLLKEAGLVADRVDGARHVYRLGQSGLDDILVYLDEMWGEVAARYRFAVENMQEGRDGE